MTKKKVLYILHDYPQISQTYIKVELEEVYPNYDIEIVALRQSSHPYSKHYPYNYYSNYEDVLSFAKTFKPNVLHSHWMHGHLDTVFKVACELNIPFTVRSHSFDTMWKKEPWHKILRGRSVPSRIKKYISWINHPLCLGMLAFPYAIEPLIKAGLNREKLIPCAPVFSHNLFYKKTTNGEKIINVGAGSPKKKFEDYIQLAALTPNRQFHLYSLGYLTESIKQKNIDAGSPLTMMEPIEHEEFAERMSDYQWMVYTADPVRATVGWPMTLLEAQASGVGVCMRNIRPDLKNYLGGAAILYDSIEELVDIVSKPVPDELRVKGFENAQKYGIKKHIHLLADLWDACS